MNWGWGCSISESLSRSGSRKRVRKSGYRGNEIQVGCIRSFPWTVSAYACTNTHRQHGSSEDECTNRVSQAALDSPWHMHFRQKIYQSNLCASFGTEREISLPKRTNIERESAAHSNQLALLVVPYRKFLTCIPIPEEGSTRTQTTTPSKILP